MREVVKMKGEIMSTSSRNSGALSRRAALGLFGAAAGTAAIAACAPAATTAPAPSQPAAQPKSGGTMRMGIVGGLTGVILTQAWTNNMDFWECMFDQLIERDV